MSSNLILIHGEDREASRQKLMEEKERSGQGEILHFDGAGPILADFLTIFQSGSLFNEQKLFIVENFLAGGVSKQKSLILDLFQKSHTSENKIIFWENKQIDKTILKKYFSNFQIFLCNYPAILFKFLDSIGTMSQRGVLSYFHQLLKQKEPELIFAMMVRLWRQLIIAKDLGSRGFPGVPPWQVRKVVSQARGFNLDQIVSSYRQLLYIDYKIKSGLTPYSLRDLLDIFLLSL